MIARAFVYGDLLFESMLVLNNDIQHVQKHFDRLVKSAAILKMDLPPNFDLNFFNNSILSAIKNGTLENKENCRARFILYRNSTGFYLPNGNETAFIIETFELPINWKELTLSTKKVGVFTTQKKAIGSYANLKTGNALIYVMAKLWAQENALDDALILNDKGNIIEAASSNIFWNTNNQFYTVPLTEGCIAGISRQVFMEDCERENKRVIEQICTLTDLQNADEIFMSNASNGVCKIELVL